MFRVSINVIFFEFLKLGLYSFGGPTAHVGFFRQKFVLKEKWLTENQYMEIVSICQFLPGPTSSQIGYTIGLLTGGSKGGLAAWLGFTLPSTLLMILGAFFLIEITNILSEESLYGLLQGFASVATPVVAMALLSMQKAFCFSFKRILITLFSTSFLFFFEFPMEQVFIISLGFIIGIYLKLGSKKSDQVDYLQSKNNNLLIAASLVLFVSFIILVILPIIIPSEKNTVLNYLAGFYKSGALVFGGGHVVLPFLEKAFVQTGFISEEMFVGGYGMVQGVPGPLFSFAAYLGAILGLSSGNALIGVAFGLICVSIIFLPGLVIMPIVLNYWSHIKTITWIRDGLGGVNASVVGLLLSVFLNPMLMNYLANPKGLILGFLSCIFIFFSKMPTWLIVMIMGPVGLTIYSFY